ncbi:MAG: hypothetical protein CME59_20875 [Halioglobus sp.]|nr:hypothetical protein [Halioglobus sp.]
MDASTYRLAADAILLLHCLFVAFVLLGLAYVYLGAWLGWRGARRRGFRYAHLACVALVVVQAWLGVVCPLTTWEMALRERAGDATYSGAFIAHWLQAVLYYRAPAWVFTLVYSVFGALVLLSFRLLPPRPARDRRLDDAG